MKYKLTHLSICIKKFRSLVVTGGGCRKGIALQVFITPTVVLTNVNSCLRIKAGITGVSIHAPRQRNITHA